MLHELKSIECNIVVRVIKIKIDVHLLTQSQVANTATDKIMFFKKRLNALKCLLGFKMLLECFKID